MTFDSGHRLDDEQILSFIRLLFPAGADTTFHATGSMIYYLLKHPEVLERLRAHPEDRDKAIEETLRIEPPVTVQPRMNPQDRLFGEIAVRLTPRRSGRQVAP